MFLHVNVESLRRSALYALLILAPLLVGCRPGLPAEPPGADAADAGADATPYTPPANPYSSSAFAGAKPSASSGHEGMKGHERMEGMSSETAPKPGLDNQPSAGSSARGSSS